MRLFCLLLAGCGAGPLAADLGPPVDRDAGAPDRPANLGHDAAPGSLDAGVRDHGAADALPDAAVVAPDAAEIVDATPDAALVPPDVGLDGAPDGPAPDAPGASDAGAGDAGLECAAARLGARLGRTGFLVGGDMDDASFAQAPFDWRAVYIANDVPENGPCASCAVGCTVNGQSCANNGCGWWGCWQSDSLPPGRYAVDFITATEAAGALPWLTYYVWHYVASETEGWPEVAALNDPSLVRPYLEDWRFFCRRVAEATDGPVFLHVEPDLWGFGEQVNENPEAIPAVVSAATAAECAAEPNTMGGLARCMLAIARAEAPGALVGFHASAWGAGADAIHNSNPGFDLLGHAEATAAFLTKLGAGAGDFVAVEMSDRDAAEDGRWWDVSDQVLPDFEQARDWVRAVAEGIGLAPVWWQVPYGSARLPNVCGRYRDNRVDYVFDWPERFATDALGVLFGSGGPCSTDPGDDRGHFIDRAGTYFAGPPPAWCR